MTRALGLSYKAYESKFELRIVMLCSMAGTLMQALDTTIANVALPYMQGSLGASRDQITWVLTCYIVSAAIMTAPVGWIASRFGRKNLAIVSLGGFTIVSMMCGAAQNLDQMILFRLLQGAFGAALAPLSQSIMLDLYPAEKRGSAMAIWSMGIMVGPILGPTFGGYLTDNYSWRWVFYINAPIGIAAVAGIALFLRDRHRDETLKFDWFGFAILATGIGALQLILDRGTSLDWFSSNEIVVETVLAVLGLYLFCVHMLTAKGTFIPRAMFGDRNYTSTLLLMFVLGFVSVASTALLPPYLQTLGGYSVESTGLLMAPRGLGMMITMYFAGQIALRGDPRRMMLVGTALMLCSMWEMSRWTPEVPSWWLMSTTFVQGFGMGLVVVPMSLLGFATLSPLYRTDGSAILSLFRNVGGAIGISVTTTFLASNTQIVHAQLADHINPFNRNLAQNAPSMLWNLQMPSGLSQLDAIINRNAQVIAYANDFLFMFVICLPVLALIYLMRKPTAPPDPRDLEILE